MIRFIYILSFLVHITTSCSNNTDCKQCIQVNTCAWCLQLDGNSSADCISKEEIDVRCLNSDVINPGIEYRELKQDRQTNYEDKQVFITPEKVKLSLRKGDTYNVTFKVSKAENYLLDLYILVDLSHSLKENHQKELENLEAELPEKIKSLTKQFRLGFGSFVEKSKMPYTSLRTENPCARQGRCVPAYVFKNHLPLSNESLFATAVRNVNHSGNNDHLEASLEALLQVMVCKEEIEWNENSIRLIILITDDGFHVAGDGKLSGIIKPNDGRCHLENNHYTHDLLHDYPSIGQVNRLAIDNRMHVIFAVPEKRKTLYDKLSKSIRTSKTAIISYNTSNIIELIEKSYKDILNRVKLYKQETDDDIDIKFYSKCNTNEEYLTNSCENFEKDVEFIASVTLKECPENEIQKIITIFPDGLNEKLIIELNLHCDCPCDKKNNKYYEQNSTKCTNSGDFACGQCKCYEGKYGEDCHCDRKHDFTYEYECRQETTADICSGNGECICGKCHCFQRIGRPQINGKYCECTNDNCLDSCSGNGRCECGKCQCNPGFTSDNCNCTLSVETCRNVYGDMCNNRGSCECGTCICKDNYSGEHCDISYADEQQEQCDKILACILCKTINNTSDCASCYFDVDLTVETGYQYQYQCKRNYDQGCIQYDVPKEERGSYKEYKDIIKVRYDNYPCDDFQIVPINYAYMSAVIIGTLLLGLIILSIFIGTKKYKEQMEYKKFLIEQQKLLDQDCFDQNRLYISPVVEVQNPMFGQ